MSEPRPRSARAALDARHPADVAFAVLAVVTFALLLFLGREMTFHSDEWNVIAVPPGVTLAGWFAPYNEHWATVLFVVYRALNEIVGLRSYVPYLAVLLLVHVVAAAGLYRLLSLASGRWVALAMAAVLLLLGNAYQDLFWAWQVGFVGSTAAGLWALAALAAAPRRRNTVGATVLLTVAVATSGIGLAFLAAAIVFELTRRDRRSDLAWLSIPVASYAAWYALMGRTAISVNSDPFTPQAAAMVPGFVAVSVAHAVAATFGLDLRLGAVATGLGVGLVALSSVPSSRRPSALRSLGAHPVGIREGLPLVLATLSGLLVLFSLIGLTRAYRGPDAAIEPRYVYPAAALVLATVGAAIGRRPLEVGFGRTAAVLAVAVLLAVALAGNLQGLATGQQIFLAYAHEVRALTALVERYQHAPAVDPDRALWPMPKPAQLLELLHREGWPSSVPPGDISNIPSDAVDRALVQLVGPSFAVVPGPAPAPTGDLEPIVWQDYSGMTVSRTDRCLTIATHDPLGLLILSVPDGSAVSLEGPPGASFAVLLGRLVDPQPADARDSSMPPAGSAVVLVPRLADGTPWKLEFGLPASTNWRLCPAAHP